MGRAIEEAVNAWNAGEGCDDLVMWGADYRQALGHAAIKALREPTEAMLNAAAAVPPRVGGSHGEWGDADPEDTWQAMIDAALTEKP